MREERKAASTDAGAGAWTARQLGASAPRPFDYLRNLFFIGDLRIQQLSASCRHEEEQVEPSRPLCKRLLVYAVKSCKRALPHDRVNLKRDARHTRRRHRRNHGIPCTIHATEGIVRIPVRSIQRKRARHYSRPLQLNKPCFCGKHPTWSQHAPDALISSAAHKLRQIVAHHRFAACPYYHWRVRRQRIQYRLAFVRRELAFICAILRRCTAVPAFHRTPPRDLPRQNPRKRELHRSVSHPFRRGSRAPPPLDLAHQGWAAPPQDA